MNFRKNISTPEEYFASSFIAEEAFQALISRLEFMTLQPNWIVAIPSGAENIATNLQSCYQNASMILVEFDEQLAFNTSIPPAKKIYAEVFNLPFQSNSIDLFCANLLLPWCENITATLKEIQRCLSREAIFTLTALGPDTLKECRELFSDNIIPQLMDMHDLGDLLLQLGFADPVLDVEYVTATYSDAIQLANDLCKSGMIHCDMNSATTLISSLPKDAENKWTITYEIIFAHAFYAEKKQEPSEDGSIKISVNELRRKLAK